LLLCIEKRVLLLEIRAQVPLFGKKSVNPMFTCHGYYLSKILDMEEHLLLEHFMKYNLRFC